MRRERLIGDQSLSRLAMLDRLILRRQGIGRLSARDPKPPVVRYQRKQATNLIHISAKKLGKIDGIGHRITSDRPGQSAKRSAGWKFPHVAIDAAARLAYSEILPDEKKESAIAFLARAIAFFDTHGVRVECVMTDDGSAYRSQDFRDSIPGSTTVRTPASTP